MENDNTNGLSSMMKSPGMTNPGLNPQDYVPSGYVPAPQLSTMQKIGKGIAAAGPNFQSSAGAGSGTVKNVQGRVSANEIPSGTASAISGR